MSPLRTSLESSKILGGSGITNLRCLETAHLGRDPRAKEKTEAENYDDTLSRGSQSWKQSSQLEQRTTVPFMG